MRKGEGHRWRVGQGSMLHMGEKETHAERNRESDRDKDRGVTGQRESRVLWTQVACALSFLILP